MAHKPRKGEVAKLYVGWIRAGRTPEECAKRAGIAQHELAEATATIAIERNVCVAGMVEDMGTAETARRLGLSRTRVGQFVAANGS